MIEQSAADAGAGTPMRYQDFRGQDFSGKKFYKADLRGSDFSGAKLQASPGWGGGHAGAAFGLRALRLRSPSALYSHQAAGLAAVRLPGCAPGRAQNVRSGSLHSGGRARPPPSFPSLRPSRPALHTQYQGPTIDFAPA